MYQQLLDLIARTTGKRLEHLDPQDAQDLNRFVVEDGLADSINGALETAIENDSLGILGYGAMKMTIGFYLGLAYARNHDIPPWIDKLYAYQIPFEKLLREAQQNLE